jgi:hypothetical protein
MSHTATAAPIDLLRIAEIETTSQVGDASVELSLAAGAQGVWRAGVPGPQIIRISFDELINVKGVRLRFRERHRGRTQQFVLSWSGSWDGMPIEIVRQQWNFSPDGSTEEVENYRVDLRGVRVLQLEIIPDINGGDAIATLAEWRIDE